MRRSSRLAAFGAAGVLALAGAGTASAAVGDAADPLANPSLMSAPALAQLAGTGGRAPAAVGCYGQTDQPHPSTHVPGTVNVVARTVCPGFAVYVSTALYRDRWYGQQFLDSGSASGTGTATTNASWRCQGAGTYTYRAYSYHAATNHNPAYTYNSRRFTC
jgi:hypothetical protein